jgi:hypothetical protein
MWAIFLLSLLWFFFFFWNEIGTFFYILFIDLFLIDTFITSWTLFGTIISVWTLLDSLITILILHDTLISIKYQTMINLETQVGITSLRNKWANTDPWTWDPVSRRSTHFLLTGYTRREPSFLIMNSDRVIRR